MHGQQRRGPDAVTRAGHAERWPNKMKEIRKLSLWWLALSPLILVLGVGGSSLLALRAIQAMDSVRAFLVPSTQLLAIEEPGVYMLWHDYEGIVQGKVYKSPEALPDGATIVLKNELTAEEIPMVPLGGSTGKSGQHKRVELGRYTILVPGKYVLSVSGFDDQRVLSFDQVYPDRFRRSAIQGNIVYALGWLGALLVIVVVIVLRRDNQKRIGQQSSGDSHPAAGPEPPQK